MAIWQDKVTRRISGWSIGETMTAELVISALEKAIKQDLVRAGAIIHSDRGSQYVSNGFRELLRKNCFRVAKEIVTTMHKRKVSSPNSKLNRKPSVTSKGIIIKSEFIQVWVTKARWNLKQN